MGKDRRVNMADKGKLYQLLVRIANLSGSSSTPSTAPMYKWLLIGIMVAAVGLSATGQEVSLYNRQGTATAYIDYDSDATIFLWDGRPVAFLEEDGQAMSIFGFNGSFLGWYADGILYDEDGQRVGAREKELERIPRIEPIKGIPRFLPNRPLTPIATHPTALELPVEHYESGSTPIAGKAITGGLPTKPGQEYYRQPLATKQLSLDYPIG
jgi:hypothetical protein